MTIQLETWLMNFLISQENGQGSSISITPISKRLTREININVESDSEDEQDLVTK